MAGCANGSDSASTTIESATHPLGNFAGCNFDFELQAWTCEPVTDLNSVGLARTNLHDAILERVDLTGADLDKADLPDAKLQYANLTVAQLPGTKT